MSGYREVASDSGYMEDDDDPDPDPVMVGITKGDVQWLVELIEDAWESRGLAPHEIPVYFTLRKAGGSEVSFDEWMDMQNIYPELRAMLPPVGPLGTDSDPPF